MAPCAAQMARYWSYPDPRPEFDGSIDDAAKALRELLRDATQLRLRSDVPVGVLLSGGIDSAVIVGLIAESGVRAIRTFTASFDGNGTGRETLCTNRRTTLPAPNTANYTSPHPRGNLFITCLTSSMNRSPIQCHSNVLDQPTGSSARESCADW